MGDSLIVRRGGSGSSKYKLVTEMYLYNKSWKVPKAKDQKFSIRLFGGGGGGYYYETSSWIYRCGGGGGYMNNGEFTLQEGTTIPITIGTGGYKNNTGGTTSFGTYLAANGGTGGNSDGGSGGSGGGGLGGGGTGYQFGGGASSRDMHVIGGNGGKYGGGGYGAGTYGIGGCLYYTNGEIQKDSDGNVIRSGLAGNGGAYYVYKTVNVQINAENGTNTIGNDQVPNGSNVKFDYDLNLQGAGLSGRSTSNRFFGGGGGYGGNGGNNCGGGGGYGGNGGNNCGGGGGYGADGGNNSGGGGGYGKAGTGGDGGKYGDGGIAAGGGAPTEPGGKSYPYNNGTFGGNGIVIIQYYA